MADLPKTDYANNLLPTPDTNEPEKIEIWCTICDRKYIGYPHRNTQGRIATWANRPIGRCPQCSATYGVLPLNKVPTVM
jgi:hypothetical protein